ncbi:erythromycin esterase family protein [Candidatus Nitrotoga sp. 1052]|uniref:erythromycin esterase family protein n=1 Tax=Candidatus Nitrotoga sp. 1052 TaxID=2886964 RepID=UPI001EF65B65|nr:erythromycin esterase family protein [Candidatus Nitrotoga sp. 1052]CAH1089956.1 putative enzyme [Candidatus Nitrotoga sp. 1052]
MITMPDSVLIDLIKTDARPLVGDHSDYDALMSIIGDARLVLLGEASHGTHEFYRERARITERLIKEKNFTAVAVEADWPSAYRVNRYVRGISNDVSATDALADFKRFPTWMWRNADVLDFIGWLREHNDALESPGKHVGFYGLDLYSLNSSTRAVLDYLDKVDPQAAQRARYRYGCFDHFSENIETYGYAASFGLSTSCEQQVIDELIDLRQQFAAYMRQDGNAAMDEFFYAEQNARLVKNAEEYYRSMFQSRASSWNLRDRHMVETLDALIKHLDRQDQHSKIVLWAHNSHLGDARATQMGQGGELNVGQLVRERYNQEAILVGFTTHHGTVTAASGWDSGAERKHVRPALPNSYESLLHETGLPSFMLPLRNSRASNYLREPRLERAIGVVYLPETERSSHYFYATLPEQFDVVLHFDETRAVEPLERSALWKEGEVPETFPFAV